MNNINTYYVSLINEKFLVPYRVLTLYRYTLGIQHTRTYALYAPLSSRYDFILSLTLCSFRLIIASPRNKF